jgi:hypothetical protein
MTIRRVSTGVTYATVDAAFAALPATLTQNEILEDIDGTAYTTTTERDITNAGAFTITLRAATAARPSLTFTGSSGTRMLRVQNSNSAGGVIIEDWDFRCSTGAAVYLVEANASTANLTMRRCTIVLTSGGPYACLRANVARSVTLENCLFEDRRASTNAGALLVNNTDTTILRYCTFTSNSAQNQSTVIRVTGHGGTESLTVQGCILRHTGVASPASNNAIIKFATTDDLAVYTGNGNVFSHSSTSSQVLARIETGTNYTDIAAWRTASGDDADSVESNAAVPHNALFVAESSNNYRLVASSPAELTALSSIATVATDLLGVTRPQGAAYDAGCYEYEVADPWQRNLDRRETSWAVMIRIEGTGDRNGQWSFSNAIPAHLDSSTCKPWLTELPEILSERVDLAGGIPEAGSCTVALLDYDDTLSSLWRTERTARTVLSEAVDTSETNILVADADSLATEVVFVGSEAMIVTADNSSPESIDVTRGALGTDALTHSNGDLVYRSTPYLEGRRVEVYLSPLDSVSSADERLVGSYVLDSVALDDSTNVWSLRCVGQHRYLDRRLPITAREGRLVALPPRRMQLDPGPIRSLWSDRLAYVQADKELIELYDSGAAMLGWTSTTTILPASIPFEVRRRALNGTDAVTITPPTTVRQVFLAGLDLRYSPGPSPSTSRASGTWTPAEQWVDLMLILLLSSASSDDGLELTNRRTTGSDWSRSNFSSLPPGMGLGIPVALIDWDSFESVRARTLSWRLPFFSHGLDPERTGAEVLSEEFLRPFGAYLSFELGTLRLGLSRAPLYDETTALQVDADVVLRRETAPGVYLPDLQVSRARAKAVGSVTYKVGPGKVAATYRSTDYARTYGQRGWYGAVEPALTVEVPGGDPRDAAFFASRAAVRLWRLHKPPTELAVALDIAEWPNTTVGTYGEVTMLELPDAESGERGWTDVPVEVEERVVALEATRTRGGGSAMGASVRVRARRYGAALRLGRIAQAARVSSVAFNAATVLANRYTHTDADDQGYPDTDAEAFIAGDRLWLTNPDGSRVGSATQTVVSVAGNVITLDGNFAGALAADLVLIAADAADAVTRQLDAYSFMRTGAGGTGSTETRFFWRWGEP